MIRYLLGLLAAVAAPIAARAAPAFDPVQHPYIQLVTNDKAVTKPGEAGNVVVRLRNPSGSPFTGTLTTTIFLGSNVVGLTGPSAISIGGNGTAQQTVPFSFAANIGERGFRVDVVVKNGGGTIVDAAAGAIDVQSSVLHARFPRQCWSSKFDSGLDAAALVTSQVAWRCNTMQAYDAYYRPELAPPSGLASWPSLANHTISRATLNAVIGAAHAVNMPVMFFQATGEAYSNWPVQAVKPSLKWGSFDNDCGKTKSCTPNDLNRSPPYPDNWTQYGWQADHLDFFDPCNAAWQQFLIDKSIRPMLGQFAFDGWQADTVGAPATNNGITYNYAGEYIDTKACLGDFTTGAAARLGKPTILNNVSGWGMVDTALMGQQPYLYRETWDFDTPYYPGLNGILAGSPFGIRRYSTRAVVQPAYINRNLSSRCDAGTQTIGCTVNVNSALLATAMFAIAGSTWMNHQNDDCIMTNVYVPGHHLSCTAATVDRLLSYKAFEVGYQNLLREAVADSVEPCNITSGAIGGTSGAAGQVYVLGKGRPGFQICHLLNLTGVSSNAWADLEGTKEQPTALTNIGMRLYYYGNTVVPSTNKLWWASPDFENGAAQALTYTAGADGQGNYITFTLPNLSYWSMIALETSVTGDNLAIDGRKPIRGGWFQTASPGVSPYGTAISFACCHRYAGYKGVQLGVSAASTISFLATASKAATVTVRLDGPKGAVIGSCLIPAGTIATSSCSIVPTAGLHDIYLEFENSVSIYGFFFG